MSRLHGSTEIELEGLPQCAGTISRPLATTAGSMRPWASLICCCKERVGGVAGELDANACDPVNSIGSARAGSCAVIAQVKHDADF
jgi:hypothetical protein